MHFTTFDVAILAIAPVAAFLSLRLKRVVVWAALGLIAALFGWAVMFASNRWSDHIAAIQFDQLVNPSSADINRYDSDAASKTVTLLFGFPLSLSYVVLWFVLVRGGRRLMVRFVMPNGRWSGP